MLSFPALVLRDVIAFCACASFRDPMPKTLRLPRPPRGLAMTHNWHVFVWEADVFRCMRPFSASINASFSSKTCQFCHCEEGAFFAPDAAIFKPEAWHPITKHGGSLARPKLRAVSLWDGSKILEFCRFPLYISFRDSIPKTLRLPRPQ